MAKGARCILPSSRQRFSCMERDTVWPSIGGHYRYCNQVYQEGPVSCSGVVLVPWYACPCNWDCPGGGSGHGRPLYLCTAHWNIRHHCLGSSRAYGEVAPQGQGFDYPSRSMDPNINDNDLGANRSLEEQYYNF